MLKKATEETNVEKRDRYALEDELLKLNYGDPLPEGYYWEANGTLRNPYKQALNGTNRRNSIKKLDSLEPKSLKEMILKFNGTNIQKLHKRMADIAQGIDKKATKLQFDAIKYLIDMYYNEELKQKTIKHNLEISFDEQLLQIAEKTKKQKLLNNTQYEEIIEVK